MKKMIAIFFLINIVLLGCQKAAEISGGTLTPAEVVRTYFEAWDQKDYATMLEQMTPGFRELEPTAKDLKTFTAYAEKQGIEGIEIVSINETFVDEDTAAVDYAIKIKTKSAVRDFSGIYTLKLKENGWKMTHPYGENVDTS